MLSQLGKGSQDSAFKFSSLEAVLIQQLWWEWPVPAGGGLVLMCTWSSSEIFFHPSLAKGSGHSCSTASGSSWWWQSGTRGSSASWRESCPGQNGSRLELWARRRWSWTCQAVSKGAGRCSGCWSSSGSPPGPAETKALNAGFLFYRPRTHHPSRFT